ncbi:TetR/AcrR family transcriptional regulator [Natroniella sp. ANB-PHB2]|uniref:TetR/AcrR family transcriptional regulator n=1 Tax=Natroniella sp. ANB-PHB2 TaxID=3384444 RepID=UPI0038D4D9AB
MTKIENMTSREIQALKTKKKLFETAIKLFKQKGYENVTIKEIANKTGTSKGTFYTYFSSKSEVIIKQFKEIDQHYIKVTENFKELKSAKEKLLFFLKEQLRFVITELNVDIVKVLYSSQLRAETEKIIKNWNRPLYKIIHKIIKEGQRNDEFRSDISSKELTEIVARCMRSIFLDWGISNGNFDLVNEGQKFFSNFVVKGLLKNLDCNNKSN